MVERVDISNVLMQMRQMKMQAQNSQNSAFHQGQVGDVSRTPGRDLSIANPVGGVGQASSFGDMFTKAINSVNEIQKESGRLSKAYELGDPAVDITRVMVASEKSSVAFQSLLTTRNKLVNAYEDIMNMPV